MDKKSIIRKISVILEKKSIDFLNMLMFVLKVKNARAGNTFFYVAEDKLDVELYKMLVSLTKKKKEIKDKFFSNNANLDEIKAFEDKINNLKKEFKDIIES